MNGKKIMAGALSAAMLLSTASFTAFAEELTQNVENGIQVLAETNANTINVTNVTDVASFNQAIATAQNNENTIIDLNNNTIEMSQYIETYKDIKITNGTINVSKLKDSTGKNAIFTGYGCKLEFENVTFNGENYDSGTAVIFVNTTNNVSGSIKLNNCTFTLKNDTNKNGVLSGNTGTEEVKVTDCTFTLTNTGRVFKLMNLDMTDSTVTATTDSEHSDNAFRNVTGKMTNCTVSATGYFENGIKNTNGNALELAGTTSVTLDNDIIANDGSTIKVAESASLSTTGTDNRVAKIGDTYYGSLEDALAAADGDTITLCQENTEIHSTVFSKDITIDAQDNNIKLIADSTVGGESLNFHTSKNITFKNANITLEDRTSTTETLFNVGGGTTVTFDNVDFTVDGYTAGAAFYNNGTINIINGSDFVLKNCTSGDNAFAADSSTAVLNIKNSKVSCDSTKRAVINQTTTIDNSTFTANNLAFGFNSAPTTIKNGSNVTITNTSAHGFTNGNLNIENNSNMTVSGCTKFGVHLSNSGNIIKGNSTLTVTNCGEAEIMLTGNEAAIEKQDTSKLVGTVLRRNHTINTNGVTVSYEDVTVNEGEKVYNLYVEADDKTINRLTSAEFTFDLDTADAIDYVVSGTQKVNVTPDNSVAGKYLFNFNGIDAADITGKKINIGQIKFTGYGTFSFAITDGEAHATTIEDNIVTDFVKEPDVDNATQGTLDYSVALTDIEIKKPTRKLTINITFPNAVNENATDYQKMNVTIKGGEYEETFALGTGEIEMTDGAYVVTKDLVKDTTYTVEVSGAGYRTARYTVTMNDNKTLNFWNNVKDNATNVEEGVASSAKNVTFLAGELVKDGKINVYDLSAVVSYFGTNNDVNAASPYAKYDLNRDGKIDSKDVAYVLVSWDK